MFNWVKAVLFFVLFPFILSAQMQPAMYGEDLKSSLIIDPDSLRRDVREARLQPNIFKPIEITTDIKKHIYRYDERGRITEFIIQEYGVNWERSEYIYGPDSTLCNSYDWINNNWELQLKCLSKYDEYGYLIGESYIYWISGKWIKLYEFEQIYDENHKLRELGRYSYDTLGNFRGQKTIYQYNANGKSAEILDVNYKEGKWENDNIAVFEYDAAGNLLSKVFRNWKEGLWLNWTKTAYSYNAVGLTADKKEYHWEGGNWKYVGMEGYVYNSKKQVIELLRVNALGNEELRLLETTEYGENGDVKGKYLKVWDYDDNDWKNLNKLTVSEADDLCIRSYETWEGGKWVNSERYTSKFDGKGNELWELRENWKGEWVNEWKEIWEYDAYGNPIKGEYFKGAELLTAAGPLRLIYDNGYDSFYAITSKITAVYEMFTEAFSEDAAELSFRLEGNYPNPFNPATVIRYSVGSESGVRIAVYNSLGEEVRVLKDEVMPAGEYEVYFDGTGLSSGVYFYEMRTTAGVRQVKKMMMVK